MIYLRIDDFPAGGAHSCLDDQHRAIGCKDEVLGDAAQECLTNRASATTTDHQQLRARLVRQGQNGVSGVIGPVGEAAILRSHFRSVIPASASAFPISSDRPA